MEWLKKNPTKTWLEDKLPKIKMDNEERKNTKKKKRKNENLLIPAKFKNS